MSPSVDNLFIPRKNLREIPTPKEGEVDAWAKETAQVLKGLVEDERTNALAVQDWANRQTLAAQCHLSGEQDVTADFTEHPLTGLVTNYDTNVQWAAPIVQNDTFVLPATGRWVLYLAGYIANQGPDFTVGGTLELRMKMSNPTTSPGNPEHNHFVDFNTSRTNFNYISLSYTLNCTAVGQTVTPAVEHTFPDAANTYTFGCIEFSAFRLSLPPTEAQ